MDFSTYDKFCWFFSLRAGGITLGCLGLILGIVEIIDTLANLHMIDIKYVYINMEISLTINVITIVVFSIYLFGIFSKKAWFMMPAIIWNFLGTSLITGILCLAIITFPFLLAYGSSTEMLCMVFLIPVNVFQWYLVFVSIVLFNQIRNPNSGNHEGVVYRTAEELANLSQGVNIEGAKTIEDLQVL